jgi:YVTN family beta-propeller protein
VKWLGQKQLEIEMNLTNKLLASSILSASLVIGGCEHGPQKGEDNNSNSCSTGTGDGATSHTGSGHESMPGMSLVEQCPPAANAETGEAVTKSAFYVVNGGNASISVVDPNSKSVLSTIALSGATFPHHMSLEAGSDRLVVAVPGMDLSGGHDGAMAGMHGSLIVLDAKTGATEITRTLDAMNHNGIFSPDGNEIWTVAMASPGSVLVLDGKTLEILKTIPVGNMPAEVTFSRDGKYAFVANGESGTVSVIDPKTKSVVKTVTVGDDPVGAWPGNDGMMYVDNEKGKSITAIDATTLAVVRTYVLGFTPGMAVTASNGELWVSDVDSGKITYFMAGDTMPMGDIVTGAGAHGIAFSADGATAAVTNQLAGTVSLIDVKTHKNLQNVKVGDKPNGIVFRAQ